MKGDGDRIKLTRRDLVDSRYVLQVDLMNSISGDLYDKEREKVDMLHGFLINLLNGDYNGQRLKAPF